MQDRFKFKVLDITNNKIYSSLEDLSKEEENAHFLLAQDGAIIKKYYNNGEIQLIRMLQYQPIFCTGLKDKNGKLIFEGDIANYNDEVYGLCKAKIIRDNAYYRIEYFTGSKYGWFDHILCLKYLKNIEVIGNIYENPELLKVQA